MHIENGIFISNSPVKTIICCIPETMGSGNILKPYFIIWVPFSCWISG